MPDETLHDLMVQVGLRSTRPRPLPQSMRPAWETTPEANQPYRAPQQALADPNTIPYQRQPLQQERDMNRELAQLTDRQSIGGAAGHADGREAREFGAQVMEATGAPSWARGINHLRNNQPGEAIPEFLMGALNTGTLATLHYGAGPARPPMRLPNAPIEAAPRLPNAPPRLPGRATDGSVLPIRPPQPIRQSLVGGSDDLMEAARIGPDAGPVRAGSDASNIQVRVSPTRPNLIEAVDENGRQIGTLEVAQEGGRAPFARGVQVDVAHQRNGVATRMYQEAERRFGRMEPSADQSDEAKAFWESYRPSRNQARSGNVLPPSPLDDMLRRMNIDPMRIPYAARREMEYNLRLHGNGAEAEAWLDRYLMNSRDSFGGGEMPTFTLPEGQREIARTSPDGGPVRVGSYSVTDSEMWPGMKVLTSDETFARREGYDFNRTLDTAHITYYETPQGWRIEQSWIPLGARSEGRGLAIYEELIRRARDASVNVISSSKTNEGSQGVYAALQRRGYTVSRRGKGGRFTVDTSVLPSRNGPNAGPPRTPPRPRPPPRRPTQ